MLQRELLAVAAASQTGWTPWALGASLLAWWDADRTDLITQAGSLVSSWKDITNGYDKVAAGSAQPTFSATSFNGRPGVAYDGVANCSAIIGSVSWLPTGAAASRDWYLLDETATAADTTIRYFGSWGGSNGTARRVGGLGETTAYHSRTSTGNGASPILNTGTIEIFGRHVVCAVVDPTQTWVEVDGVAQTATAVVPATNVTNLRTAATSAAAAGSFAQMTLAVRIITGPLSAGQTAQLTAWLMRRK